jgi:hypothetical protein
MTQETDDAPPPGLVKTITAKTPQGEITLSILGPVKSLSKQDRRVAMKYPNVDAESLCYLINTPTRSFTVVLPSTLKSSQQRTIRCFFTLLKENPDADIAKQLPVMLAEEEMRKDGET